MNKVLLALVFFASFTTYSYSQSLHIYGGKNNDVYLGCVNCNKFDENSIWNAYGTYGSKFSSKSIWNQFSEYGSKFSSYSPWSAYSSDPPVIVDKEGNFYGYFTVNSNKDKRSNSELSLTIYKYYDLIKDDVSAWYDKIFE